MVSPNHIFCQPATKAGIPGEARLRPNTSGAFHAHQHPGCRLRQEQMGVVGNQRRAVFGFAFVHRPVIGGGQTLALQVLNCSRTWFKNANSG